MGAARIILLIAPFLIGAADAPAKVALGEIKVRLLYQYSATLSGNVASPAKPSLWNTVIGEGDAREPATDALVTVGLTGGEPDTVTDRPLIVTVRAGGKVLTRRRFDDIIVPMEGATWSALWLPDVTCKGHVTVEATYGTQRKTAAVDFDCGE
jgi:hypothetical protein